LVANIDIFVHLALDDTNSGGARGLSYVGTEGPEHCSVRR